MRNSGVCTSEIELDAAGDYDLHAVDDDLLGRRRDGHQAGGALPVERHAGNRHRKSGA